MKTQYLTPVIMVWIDVSWAASTKKLVYAETARGKIWKSIKGNYNQTCSQLAQLRYAVTKATSYSDSGDRHQLQKCDNVIER
jgi:hypothetical protein